MEALALGAFATTRGYGVGVGVGVGDGSPRMQQVALLHSSSSSSSSSCCCQMHRKALVCFATSATETCLPEERKKLSPGLFQSYTLSPELQAVVGKQELSRAQVTKQLWLYIRKNNLQDPDNKRRIICDDALRSLFEVHVIDMFEMNKVLSKHIRSPEKASVAGGKRGSKVSGLGKSAGLLKPQPISEALQTFLGVSATEIVRSDAVKFIWRYIKQNNLQDPANRRNIICDGNLQELLQCESFQGFHLTRLLVPHFPKKL